MRPSYRSAMVRQRAFSITDFWWLLVILAMLFAILLPSLARARQIAKRSVCMANLRATGVGINVYANDNAGWYPAAPFTPSKASKTENSHEVTFIEQLSRGYDLPSTHASLIASQHPSRSLFLLVTSGICVPEQLVCPDSEDQEDDLRNWRDKDTRVASQPGVNRFDFRGYDRLSYGYQLPFGNKGQPRSDLDPRMPIMADKGPLFEAAAAGEQMSVADKLRDGYTQGAALQLPDTWEKLLKAPTDVWRPFNTRNHNSEGQSVLHQDGHVDFEKNPIVGVNYDNIYTTQPSYRFEDSMSGNVPKDKVGPFSATDSVIVP